MLVSDLITLGRLWSQDTNTAATHQPIGATNYLLMVNDILRLYRARIDERLKYLKHSDIGTPTQGTCEFSTPAAGPNIREVVAFYLIDAATEQSWAFVSAGKHWPIQFLAPHRMKALIAVGAAALPVGRTEALAGRDKGLFYSFEYLPDEPKAVHFMVNWQIGFLRLEVKLHHTDHTLTTEVVDVQDDEAAYCGLVLGAYASQLLDKEPEYIQGLMQRVPETWRDVYMAEMRKLVDVRRREFADARAAG